MSLTTAVLALIVVLTSTLSGVIGMAGGITLLALMTFFYSFEVIVPVHGIVQLVSNSSRALFLFKKIHRKITLYFFLGAPIGALISVQLIKSIENKSYFLLAIAVLILYTLFKPKKLPELNIPISGFFIIGICAGFLGLLVGATGPFMAPFFLRNDLEKEQIVATKAATQMFVHFVKIPAFIFLDFPYKDYILILIVLSIASIIGTKLGVTLLGKINESIFKKLYKAALFIAAARLFYKVLMPLFS